MGIEELRASAYWTECEAREALALWKRSGTTLAAFSRQVGLSRSRLSYWRDRLGEDRAAFTSPITLAPVTVLASRSGGVLTIELRSGRAVRIEGDVDDATLARVIAIAERAC